MSFPASELDESAIPLGAAQILAIDTETDSLDVAAAHIIEIGAVAVDSLQLVEDSSWSALVNPGEPIAPASIDVHGIRDEDVADAGDFAAVMPELAKRARERIVVGYSVGYDIAILKNEHRRADIQFHAPRVLDVARLVRMLSPQLPGLSLDLVAKWLGIKITDRHRALGDAVATAKIFCAIVPQLAVRGIRTVAQAERACLSFDEAIRREEEAGWHLPESVRRSDEPDAAYARVDTFPFRHRVSELMSTPLCSIEAARPAREALALMLEKRVSSLLITRDGEPAGIATERDFLRAANAGPAGLDTGLQSCIRDELFTVEQDDFAYRAMVRMSQANVRHLVVTNEEGDPVGMLTPRNLLEQRSADAISLGDRIELARDPAALGRVWGELALVAASLQRDGLEANLIAAIISRELRALTRRACEMAEETMREEGWSECPVTYTMLVLGSGARGESLLAMDQDNALVYETRGDGAAAAKWLEEFGKRVCAILNMAGLAYCAGGIMASQVAWRHDSTGWRRTITEWISASSPDALLACDIYFDSRGVQGAIKSVELLRSWAFKQAAGSRMFISFLGLHATKAGSPFGMLNRLKTENGRIDLKLYGLLPIVATARALAVKHGIMRRSTPGRLAEAAEREAIQQGKADEISEAFSIFMNLILRQQLTDLPQGLPLGSKVQAKALSSYDRQRLEWALHRIPDLAGMLEIPTGA